MRKKRVLYKNDFLLEMYKKGLSYSEAIKIFNKESKEGLWDKYSRVVKENGAIILFGQDKFTGELMASNIKDHRYNLIWKN